MKLKQAAFLVIFLSLIGNAVWVFSQSTVPFKIINPDKSQVTYCKDPVLIAPNISVQNTQINESSEGMKISIVNYIQGEDILIYDELSQFDYRWDGNIGNLEIKGKGSAEEYQEAISKVYYKNLANTPSVGVRNISITLLDADFFPQTEHFYQYIDKRGIRWTAARDAAEAMNYYGLKGYLVTITSAAENDFVWSKIDGVGWIGASDHATEGQWYWMTGPEAGTLLWSGSYAGGYAVNGAFSYWNNGEPNNVRKSWGEDEDYAHVVVAANSKPKSWNDLSDEGDKDNPNGDYYPQGYVVEFGGMPGEPELNLSATSYIEVKERRRPELDFDQVQTLYCGVKSATVGLIFREGTPLVDLNAFDTGATVENGTSLQPTITVEQYGQYYFQLNTIDEAGCSYVDTVMFEFHNQPEAQFNLDEDECYGYNLQLQFTGNTVEETDFTWYYNSEEFATGTDLDNVTIPLGFEDMERTVGLEINEQGCVDSSLPLPVKVKPDIIALAENTDGCSPLTVNFTATTNKPAWSYHWDFGDDSFSSQQNPSHHYINNEDVIRTLNISLTVQDNNGCVNTAVYDSLVKVFPVPSSGFDLDPEEVLITDPEVSFINTSHAATLYSWDFGDSIFTDEKDPVHRYSEMGVYLASLKVSNDFQCADTLQKAVTVTFDRLFPPNAFSPDAPLEEDKVFRLYGEGVTDQGYQLMIFNRWGEEIFVSHSQEKGWDGKMKNTTFAPAGVYTWVLQYTDFTGEKHTQQGNVTLIY